MKQSSSIRPTKIVFNGKTVNAKIVSISSIFKHNTNVFFDQELRKENTPIIVKPLATIHFLKENTNSPFWEEGFEYELEIKPYGLFNLWGIHYIKVIRIDKPGTTIITKEKNDICKVWDHTLTFKNMNDRETEYTDQVILYAGAMTNFLSYFLVYSYKKRHRNWDQLLSKHKKNNF